MPNTVTNQAIIDSMLRSARRDGSQGLQARAAAPQPTPTPCSGFTLDNFTVAWINRELIANVAISSAPAGTTVVGVTIVVSAPSGSTYCMGVAAQNSGLPLPVSELAASSAPVFSAKTTVTGSVVIAYMTDDVLEQCVTTQQFTVGG